MRGDWSSPGELIDPGECKGGRGRIGRHQGWTAITVGPSGRTGSGFTSSCACAPLKAAGASLSAAASAVSAPVAAIRQARRHSYGDRRPALRGSTADAAYGHTRQKHSVEQVFRPRCQDRRGGTGQGIRPGTGPLGVVMSERRNPNPHPPRPHLSSLTRHLRASHPSHSCTLIHEEPVFDGFPRRQTCCETRVQFPRKP
jgi:hypothetical protein